MEPVETTSMLQGEIPTNRNHAQVDSLNHWMFERVKPYIRGRVMEIGSGTGDLAAVCFQDQISMYLSDEDETYRDLLNERFADEESLKGVMSVNLKDADFENRYANYIGVFDTIVALDITKPVTIETLAISNCAKLLRKGGYLFIHLPVHTALYNGLDLGLKSWYNYNLDLIKKLLFYDFEIVKIRYFNIGNAASNPDQVTRYHKYVPSFPIEDLPDILSKGLSVLIVGKKKRA